MDDAIKKVKQLAASALARRDRFEEELRILEKERAVRLENRELALGAQDDDLALEVTTLLQDLDRRVEIKRGELAEAEEHYQEILGELRSIQNSRADLERARLRAPVDAVAAPDPFSTSAEDVALENVRRHIDELTARAELEEELRPSDRDLSRRIAELEKSEAEAKAKAQLAELKAKRSAGASKETDAPAQSSIEKPKKTM